MVMMKKGGKKQKCHVKNKHKNQNEKKKIFIRVLHPT